MKQAKQSYRYSIAFRAMVLCCAFVMLLTALSMRLIHVQLTLHDEVTGKVAATKPFEVIPARRGDVLDRYNHTLATVEPISDLVIDKHQIPSPKIIKKLAVKYGHGDAEVLADYDKQACRRLYYQMLSEQLADPLGMQTSDVLTELVSKKMNQVLAEGMDCQTARSLVTHLKEDGFAGLYYRNRMRRTYPNGSLACHVLGFVYRSLGGAAGVEHALDGLLAGKDGKRYLRGENKVGAEEPPKHGSHVVLTIDSAFQELTEDVLDQSYDELGADRVTAIFAEPHTGEILALVNRPGFDPRDGGNANKKSRWNTAIASNYEPGSTFKLVVHGAALDQGLVRLDTVVNCHNGRYKEAGWKKPLTDASKPRDSASIREVLGASLNTGTFEVAQQLNSALYFNYIRSFGFGEKVGIRISGETKGRVPHPDGGWGSDRFSLSRLGMGYNVMASPLQILGAMSVVCNHGNLVKPRIVREVLNDESREKCAVLRPEVVKDVISARAASNLKEAMIYAVQEGTGPRAAVEGYVVGGKTGTADKHFGPEVGYLYNRNLASFLGFIGTEEDVVLIGFVLVDDPQTPGKRHGGNIAAPIFQKIASAAMQHFGVRKAEVTSETAAVD